MVRRLVEALGGAAPPPALERDVADVHVDSRRVGRGDLFCALPGRTTDGARFAGEALARGAACVLAPARVAGLPADAPLWTHPDARRVAGEAAALVHGRPARAQRTAGITGTNGKTTTAWLTAELARAAGLRPGLAGTLGYRPWGGAEREATHTTPDATELQRLLAANRDAGGDAFVCEVSSHALDQERAAGLELDVAVFTNLGRDHLDYHGTLERYAAAKARLFDLLKPDGAAVVNADDAHADRMLRAARAAGATGAVRTVTFGTGSRCDLRVSRPRAGREGIHLCLAGMGIQREGLVLPLVGLHNVENAVAALAAALLMGASPSRALEGLATVSAPPGRLEPVDTGGRGFGCYVDYAHTAEALERALAAVRPLADEGGRVIVVFGCGGDRDAGKRAPMGAAAARGADLVVVTSDNPRSEDPAAIAAEVERGARAEGGAEVETCIERRAAIRRALSVAGRGDVVLIAGKGHETWQLSAGNRLPFDDRVVASEELGP